jgi:hypothetical protein
MKILNGFWFNAVLAVFFGVYGVAFLTGAATPDPWMAGIMALALSCDSLVDAIKAKYPSVGQ